MEILLDGLLRHNIYDMTKAAEQLKDFLRSIYAPADRRGVVEWCEDELFLSEKQTQMAGKFSTRLTPYMREPLECAGNPEITEIGLCFGTQLGKSTLLQAAMGWRVSNKPLPALWVLPNEKLAKSFSENRWIPLCEDSPSLQAITQKAGKLEQHFNRCSVTFVGSNSPTNLSSRPAGILILDETDKFRSETDKETSAIFLAENRTKSFAGALKIKTSTPTLTSGEIWTAYLQGTCEKYMLECPHCKKRIELEFENIKWNPEAKIKKGEWNLELVNKTARYECQLCGEHWNDGQKIEALQTGIWQATNKNAAYGVRTFHLNSIYAPWRSCTFGNLAVKFLKDKKTINGLRDFTNSTLALPWIEKATEIEEQHLVERKLDYELGTLIEEPTSIIIGADVQQAFTNYVIRAFNKSKSWLIDYGKFASVDDLIQYASTLQYNYNDKQYKITAGLIDSGYATEHVYRACFSGAKLGLKILPSKGSGERFLTTPIRLTELNINGRTYQNSLVIYSDGDFKRLLYNDCIKENKLDWFIPSSIGTDYTAELLREKMSTVTNARGYDQYVWKRYGANHYADAEKLALVCWSVVNFKF